MARGPRGPYKPRDRPPEVPNQYLEDIRDRNTSAIPDLDVRPASDDSEDTLALVRIGNKETDDGTEGLPVFMMPVCRTNKETIEHYLKFYAITEEGGISEAPKDRIIYEEWIIGDKLFNSDAAKSRWSKKEERTSEHTKWLLFIWQHLTGDELPKGKVTSKAKKRTKNDGDNSSAPGTPKRKAPRLTLPPPLTAPTKIKTIKHRSFEVWEEWLSGTFAGIDNDEHVKRIQKAFFQLHGREPKPSIKVLRDAYKQRLATKSLSSQQTQAWTQFRETQTGSKAVVTLDLSDDYKYAAHALPGVKVKTNPGRQRIDGPPAQPLPNPLPTLDESWQILRDWEARGADEWDEAIHEVRAARYVLAADFYQKWMAKKNA